MSLGAIILTGGASSRMGEDKAAQLWDGASAAERVAALAHALGAQPVLAVGRPVEGLPFVADDAPGGGPAGGVMAGLVALGRAGVSRVLVLAVDAPTLGKADLAPLIERLSPGAAFEGFPLPMVIYLDAAPQGVTADWPLRRLVERAGLATIKPPADLTPRLRGANTPAERAALLGQV